MEIFLQVSGVRDSIPDYTLAWAKAKAELSTCNMESRCVSIAHAAASLKRKQAVESCL